MRKYAVLIFILLLNLVACGKVKKADSQVTEVVFWHAMGGPLGDALNNLIAEFNQTHPAIKIKAVNMGNYQALSQKIMASIQANNQPDLAQVFESWSSSLVQNNVITPMQNFIDADANFAEDLTDFYPVFLESNKINGKIWSFPFNKSVRIIYYNKDLFYQVGLDPQQPPKTWEEFRNYCRRLTNKEKNTWGTTFSVSAWQFENLLLQAGGEIMDANYREPKFNSAEGVEALKFLADLLNKDKTAYLSTGYEGQNDFLAGKVGIMENSSVSLAYMKKNGIQINIGMAPLPTYKTNANIISGTNVVIFNKENKEKQKAAWEFVKWFTSPAITARWSEATYYMPVRRSALKEPALKDMLTADPNLSAIYAQLETATYEPPLAQWFPIRKELEEQVIEKVLRGAIEPKKALDTIAQEFKEMLISEKK